MDSNSAYMLTNALAAHAQVVSDAALLNAKVASMNAENMQRESLGQSMAYCDKDFQVAISEAGSLGYNAVAGSFRY